MLNLSMAVFLLDRGQMTSKRSGRDPEELLPLKPIELLALTMLSAELMRIAKENRIIGRARA